MKFSYIICYRHQPDRYENLLKTIDYFKSNFDLELILVEQDTESKIPDPSLFDQHIFTYSNRPFNRSWAFNVGAKYANSNKLFFGDCDLICPVDQMNDTVNLLNIKGCVSPYDKVVDLQPHESYNVDLESWSKITRNGRGGTNLTGGIIGFRKDEFEKISGWCEDFEGWGGEDDFQTWKVKNWVSYEFVEGNVYHIYHDRPQIDQNVYRKNLGILQNLGKRDPKEVVQWINHSRSLIGNENKYNVMTKEDEFKSFLKGKKVAIVGPAPSIIGSEQKELIEGYDVVVRLSKAVPVPEERIKDVGSRTDIYYHCMSQSEVNCGPINYDYLEKNCKFIASPYPAIPPFDRDIIFFNNQNKGRLNLHIVDGELYDKFSKEMNTRPNTGVSAIIDLLSHDILELYVTGFTFFKGGYDKTYRNQTEEDVMKIVNGPNDAHHIEPQIKYLRNLFKIDDRLSGDEKLMEIINDKG